MITFTRDHRLASRSREGLIITSADPGPQPGEALPLFRRSLRLRQVSAAGCNACEADSNVLTTPVFDLGRYGLDFVASPRHADGLAVTGPVSGNMRQALLDTFEAVPDPRLVIAVGTCAISGGVFQDSGECHKGVSALPVDLYIPGCPPHPWSILDGFLMLLGRSRVK
jgi:Ni,Fe-hydrogenase III small subunit